MPPSSLVGKFALVTGASRGIGRGIALQLGQAGATVFITGRQPAQSFAASHADFAHLPSLEKTERDIEARGGKAVALYCDHSDSREIQELFKKIETQTKGQLDILVNNAFSAVSELNNTGGRPFYQLDPSIWDAVNNVGLRNHYFCAVYACRMMTQRKSGLVVNVSSLGGLTYAINVSYGCGKAALDRMATDMAEELRGTGVSIVSLWPAAVKTEASKVFINAGKTQEVFKGPADVITETLVTGESPEFAGKCVVALASDAKINRKSGKVLLTGDIAREYGFKDIDDRLPMDSRSLKIALRFLGWRRLASWIPAWVRIPLPGMHFAGYKFTLW
ncbi:hypothetical protein PFISCL1PPCAC_6796 [Pristionchus fissidentatus]|uniref:Dehydrogenase n=1 Tax=Pristionchus fissidentatus TaxID=1538716 RepID=A0AAV5V7Q7_9BILA|nr:hypothetical protein PFISCL1PPCAC_6796 [Pristionchus fissidentatus]